MILPFLFAIDLNNLCNDFNKKIKEYYWGQIVCKSSTWDFDPNFVTEKGYPLPFKVIDFEPIKSTTLVMCGIHGDELPSPFICIHLMRDILFDNKKAYKNARVIIAPLISPDSFLLEKQTRTNSRGVDVNRNFPTADFEKDAINEWKKRYRSDKRKFPGDTPGSEIETKFQMMLIDKYKPDKILSVHSPLGLLDVDAPLEDNNIISLNDLITETKNMADLMSKKSNNYPVKKFTTYPGSLGTYAALERKIPTYTIELPTSASHKAYSYWRRLRLALVEAINYEMPKINIENKE